MRDYFQGELEEKDAKSKAKGGAGRIRWFGRALVHVAALVKRHVVSLRQAMAGKHDDRSSTAEELEAVQTELGTALAQVAFLEAKVAKLEKVADAHRKLKARSKEQRAAAAANAKAKQKAALVLQNSKHVARVREARARVEAEATRKAEAQAAAETAKLKRRVATAKARARKVEGRAKESQKRLKRLKVAEAKVNELQAALEEEDESEDEPDESEPMTVESSRRDARGRFRPLSQKIRILIWSQLSRRVPP